MRISPLLAEADFALIVNLRTARIALTIHDSLLFFTPFRYCTVSLYMYTERPG
jgi:hypothetical protein